MNFNVLDFARANETVNTRDKKTIAYFMENLFPGRPMLNLVGKVEFFFLC